MTVGVEEASKPAFFIGDATVQDEDEEAPAKPKKKKKDKMRSEVAHEPVVEQERERPKKKVNAVQNVDSSMRLWQCRLCVFHKYAETFRSHTLSCSSCESV